MKKLLIAGILSLFLAFIFFNNKYDDSLVIGVDSDYYPMCYKKNGKLTGFEIEFITATFKNSKIKYKIKDINWQEKYDLLENNKIDLIWSGLVKTNERKAFTNFTKTYLLNKQVIVTHNASTIVNFSDLSNQKIGVYIKSSAADKFLNSNLKTKTKTIIIYKELSEACQQLNSKKIDALVIDSVYINHEIKKHNYKFHILKETLGEEKMSIGLRKDYKNFSKINNIISKSIKSNKFSKLKRKWFDIN